MKYLFKKIEINWQDYWKISKIFEIKNLYRKKKCYVLDMFPYPSGSGLHIGHPLGYIISDIFARFKRSEGYNVLHPIGFDSFGLPTEQFAIETGQHPNITTETNIKRYKKQLEKLGFSFDWTREIQTNDPYYYRWTQCIFLQFFNSWYDKKLKKSRYIVELTKIFEKEGNWKVKASSIKRIKKFSNEVWSKLSFNKKEKILKNFRIASRSISTVNWCSDLGTVLANDEIKNGRSERGGFRIYKKNMMQWNMRIIFFIKDLLSGLNKIEWTNAIKEIQRHWIGRFSVSIFFFSIITHSLILEVFSKQPYTIFEVSFILIAPEHPIIKYIITNRYKKDIEEYIQKIKNRNEYIRGSKFNDGIFIGFYAKNPFTKNEIPIYLSDYVLANYGTGAIMIGPILNNNNYFILKSINKTHILLSSIKSSIKRMIEKGVGLGGQNYRLRDVVFSRQRYWGEPIPIYYKNNVIPCVITENKLPLLLPEIDKYLPPEDGSPPLKRAKKWAWDEIRKEVVFNNLINKKNIFPIETMTMPSWAGSSWYILRYMNTKIKESFVDNEAYWKNVDLYVGGAEHATGHLIYSRFWHKLLKDHRWINIEEPFQKLVNQGMILGNSAFIARVNDTNKFLSAGLLKNKYNIPIDIQILKYCNILDIEKFKKWRKEFDKADLITENGQFYCQRVLEKMSKSKYNVINPDKICLLYGADTFRLFEMFLGPINQDKPWNEHGITGVYSFIKKLWNIFYKKRYFFIEDSVPSLKEYKILYTLIKKVREDMVLFSFNTSISSFMIAVNELNILNSIKISILEPIIMLISPFSPHFSEELWHCMGYKKSVSFYKYPACNRKYSLEKTMQFTIMHNGKLCFKIHYFSKENEKSVMNKILNHPKMLQYSKKFFLIKVVLIPYLVINFM